MQKVKSSIFWGVFNIALLAPFFLLVWDYTQGQLTANPIREIQLRTGSYTLTILTLSLACTPVYYLTGFKQVLLLRRPLGLYAFKYALLHFLNFVWLDYGFNFALLWEDIEEKRYIFVGLAAFLILLALAITSPQGIIERIGRTWAYVHRLVYLAAVLGVVHYLWLVKVAISAPFIYGGIVAVLLLLRLPFISRKTAGLFRLPKKD